MSRIKVTNLKGKSPRLVVYRASAGSGKTFTLAVEYIKLLVKDPEAYRNILAVTFTNKATAEMKERILSQLYGLSHALPDSDSYLNQIMSEFRKEGFLITEQEVRQHTSEALQLILHDYSNFNVETIDSFFQRILRNLARELELNANLRVELNDIDIEELAVDKLITELKEDDKVLRWIKGFVREKLKDDKDWNVVKTIKDFGKKIFSNEYKKYSTAINDKMQKEGFFDLYQKKLQGIMQKADNDMRTAGDKFFSLIEEYGYNIESFKNGLKGPAGYFNKLSKGNFTKSTDILGKRVISALEGNKDEWLSKGNDNPLKEDFVVKIITPLIKNTENLRLECAKKYNAAVAALANLNELRLLNNIERIVKEINSDTNRFLLSDTQAVLSNIMKGQDTPFVFEKMGGRIHHIMIDEFQDTSILQWDNFKKLLLECMAHLGSQNLIVGDVKQSIYRWRNSDWNLLNDIENDSDFKDKELVPITLDKNFRSEKNIVDFNNAFFVYAPKQEKECLEEDDNTKASLIEEIFSPELTRQELPKIKDANGLIDIRLLSAQNNEEFLPKCIELTKEYIRTLLSSGAEPNGIAILFRENGYIPILGSSLNEAFPECTFVSDEAFLLSSSVAVNIIVNAMKALYNDKDLFSRAQLALDFQVYILEKDPKQILFDKKSGKEDINKWLPKDFFLDEEHLRNLSLNDMAKAICLIYKIEKLQNESAYVNAFFDSLSAFTKTNIPDLDNFIEYWDSVMYKKTINGGELKGIRLLTIHKAKGLEFDHVIVPFCDWELDKGSTLWIEPNEQPFSDMPVLPLNSKKLKETIFSDAYHEEKLQNAVDNLNTLYVAFTRAKKNLFVIGKNSLKEKRNKNSVERHIDLKRRSGLLQKVLPQIVNELGGATYMGNVESVEDDLCFTYGSLYVKNEIKKTSENIFLKEKDRHLVNMTFSSNNVEFRQSNSSRQFVSISDDEIENKTYINQGNVFHKILSQIYHLSDVERVIGEFQQEGVLSETNLELNKANIANLIKQRVENNKNPLVREWFSSNVEVLNESTILTKDPQTGLVVKFRPDRVVRQGEHITVIDFKFAKPKEDYISQVKTYMNLLCDMGYNDVKGYLWYVYKNEIVEVK